MVADAIIRNADLPTSWGYQSWAPQLILLLIMVRSWHKKRHNSCGSIAFPEKYAKEAPTAEDLMTIL